ncbi:MAG: class I adenylate-forming enzyme family protein [Candidatus Omnitrophica bacterium]|nr:class I adenylate-forming enzyme family protein [Candidatus Omnitrophota bacterium]
MLGQIKYSYLRYFKGLFLPRDIIRAAVKRNSHRIAVVDGGRSISYSDLYFRANRLAVSLLAIGVSKGEKLAVILDNCQEFFEIRIACYLTGIVLVPVLTDLPVEDYVFILNDCCVKALIYHPELLNDKIKELKSSTKVDKYLAVTEDQTSEYETFLSKGADLDLRYQLMEYDYASINFSSGTTGRPKGVELSQKSWMNSFYGYAISSKTLPLLRPVILHSLWLGSAGGTSFLPAFFLGAKNVVTRKFDPEDSADLIKQHNVDTLFMSPGYFVNFLHFCESNRLNLNLKNVVVGTECVPREIFKRAIKLFGRCVKQGYGMVEVLPPLTMLTNLDYRMLGKSKSDFLLSVGKPSSGRLARIVDDEGKDCPVNSVGRIKVKSPSSALGYYKNRQLTEKHFSGGWFKTDDYGYIDKKGYLYVLGRKEDLISRTGDDWFFAREVLEVIYKIPGIIEAVVCPVSESGYAVVAASGNDKVLLEQEVVALCERKFGADRRPKKVVVAAKIDKNSSGKVDRRKIKSLVT